jgi:hypothetical protein
MRLERRGSGAGVDSCAEAEDTGSGAEAEDQALRRGVEALGREMRA